MAAGNFEIPSLLWPEGIPSFIFAKIKRLEWQNEGKQNGFQLVFSYPILNNIQQLSKTKFSISPKNINKLINDHLGDETQSRFFLKLIEELEFLEKFLLVAILNIIWLCNLLFIEKELFRNV